MQTTILGVLIAIGLVFLGGKAIDNSVDNQNVMNCKSALVSKNMEWQDKCAVYYETGEYEYLRYK